MVLISSCAAKPPQETGTFKSSDLVELKRLDPTIQLDIRYATSNNFAGRPVYSEAQAFLQRPAAEALARVNKELEPLGYRLLIFDGYRPWSVTKVFWDITPKAKREFVANPKKGSRHNRGCAVDLSLWDIAAAKEVQMTGEYDEMSPRSYANYAGGTPAQRALRDLLRSKMEQNGFTVLEAEWWHFDFQGWKSYRIQNVPFNKI
ncbi:M15 family metallopeptidase [Hymenobacter sedentarius]|uniref:M15 family metallopeptidase n=1 Tax=Hymenobacter sedentarius TaxID=1411621 RepID=UPI0018EE616D|nr:M15 family metallopeptidase [Hymenobacter sedentarius]